ncbi:MAG: 50S ribosomal protein L11 methyltransferase, partial [Prevotella sp.]|nr:50S ribosomal protein L11 methyltransferase [Prevotella sp.]
GTGILGIAASKLGAKEIIGYDIDEWSTHNATHNASINNVTNMQVMLGDASILKEVKEKFDVVLANINRNILLSDMPVFASLMTIGSTLIISGFYSSDVPLLEEKAAELGMEITGMRTDNEWTCLTLNKKK